MTAHARTALALVALLSALPGNAAASLSFPGALLSELQLEQVAGPAPGCRLCHKDDAGGAKTATTPFGRALTAAGVVGGNVPRLLAALEALEADGVDSDGDGAADVTELRTGEDPNVALDDDGMVIPMDHVPLPQTGCALGAGSGPTAGVGWWLLAAVWLRRRLRIRRFRRPRAAQRLASVLDPNVVQPHVDGRR